jgi:basic membrane protein A and related proteins
MKRGAAGGRWARPGVGRGALFPRSVARPAAARRARNPEERALKRVASLLGLLIVSLALGPASMSGAAREPFRVGLVLDPQLAADAFFYGGLERAERELGVQGKVLVPSPREGFAPSLRSLARQKYDLIFGVGGSQVAPMEILARKFRNSRFAVLDVHTVPAGTPRNLWGVGFAEQEVGYLVGYLAARIEQRRPGRDVVSAVGGIKIPPVDAFIAGYRAGARRANPKVATLNGYSESFIDRTKCRTLALGQIAKGSGVVFNVAGYCGFGALEAAKRRGVWGIGVDVDQSSLGPHILTSALKRGSPAVFEVIRTARQGRFRGGRASVLGLREGAVALGRFSPKVPRSLIREVDRIRRQIIAGTITNIPSTVR